MRVQRMRVSLDGSSTLQGNVVCDSGTSPPRLSLEGTCSVTAEGAHGNGTEGLCVLTFVALRPCAFRPAASNQCSPSPPTGHRFGMSCVVCIGGGGCRSSYIPCHTVRAPPSQSKPEMCARAEAKRRGPAPPSHLGGGGQVQPGDIGTVASCAPPSAPAPPTGGPPTPPPPCTCRGCPPQEAPLPPPGPLPEP